MLFRSEENLRFQKLYSLTNEQLFEYSLAADTLVLSNPQDAPARTADTEGEQSEDGSFCLIRHARSRITAKSNPEMLAAFTSPTRTTTDLCYKPTPDTTKWLRITSHLVTNDEGRPLSVIGKITRIDDEIHEKLVLSNKANHDGLTGLLNWETYQEKVSSLLARGKSSALLVIDADDFKKVNDSYGHLAGDNALRRTAEVLRAAFRPDDLTGRLGGDEFGLCISGAITHKQIIERCKRIVNSGITYPDQDGIYHTLTLSVGAVELPETPVEYQDVYRQADNALYRAKAKGKNCFVIEPFKRS